VQPHATAVSTKALGLVVALPEPKERRLLRERAGLSQDQLAALIGRQRSQVSRYERDLTVPRGAALDRYLRVLLALRDTAVTPSAPDRTFELLEVEGCSLAVGTTENENRTELRDQRGVE
jgi:transcriptional regulator with XRE-family HTH domain